MIEIDKYDGDGGGAAALPFLRFCKGRLCSRTKLSGGRDLSQEVEISVLVDPELQRVSQ